MRRPIAGFGNSVVVPVFCCGSKAVGIVHGQALLRQRETVKMADVHDKATRNYMRAIATRDTAIENVLLACC